MDHVGIVGCGIGGLALAIALRQQDRPVTVFDKFDTPQPVGSGLVMQPVGLEVLRVLDCETGVRALGTPLNRMVGHEANSGRVVLDVTYDKRGVETGLAIHRASLFHVLYQKAHQVGVEIKHGAEIVNREEKRLVCAGGERTSAFDLIIDAAGAGSPLSPLQARPLPYGAVWGTVPWATGTELPWDELRQCYRGATKMMGILPLGQMPDNPMPVAAVFWSLPLRYIANWGDVKLEDWKREAHALWPEAYQFLEAINSPTDMTPATYTHGQLARPYGDGIVHIGDAAHRASPQLGQGANMALLDALALARAIERGPANEAGGRYHRARRMHVWLYQALSRSFTPQYQSDSTVLPILRDHLLTPISRIPPTPRLLSLLVRGKLAAPLGDLTHPS
jgi:2-polyprenyl-6-methoxyphenol hydroxylase-like FAD-dependent oxidoreductase